MARAQCAKHSIGLKHASNLTCAAWHPHLDFVECYEFWQSSKDCQKLYHHYGPWIFTNHAISCAKWKSTSDDIELGKGHAFQAGKLHLPRSWPLGHRITFMTYTMQRCTQEQSCWQMPLDPLCSFHSTFHISTHTVISGCVARAWTIAHQIAQKNPTHPPQLHSMKRVQEKIVEEFQISKDFNLFQNVNLIQNPQILTSTSPKQPKQPLPLWRHQRMW